jgi:ribose transport system substrate-binding protein
MKRVLLIAAVVIVAAVVVAVILRRPSPIEPIVWYGPQPHPYNSAVMEGVEGFEKDQGVPVYKKTGQEGTQDNENLNIEALSTKGYMAFSFYPIDAAGANGLAKALKDKGARIVFYGAEPTLPTPAAFTVATDIKAAAMTACEELIRLMGDKGNILNVLESVTDLNTRKRDDGIKEVVARHPNVRIVQTLGDMPTLGDAVTKIQSALAARGGQIDGIICTGYNTTIAAASILTEWHKDPNHQRIRFVGIDTDTSVLQAIRHGAIDATIAQNTYGHGYIPCAILKLMLDGWTPAQEYQFLDAGIVIVHKDNVDDFAKDLRKVTDTILKDIKIKYLKAPPGRSDGGLRPST